MAGKVPSPGVMENAFAFLRFCQLDRLGVVQAVLRIDCEEDGTSLFIEGTLDHDLWRQRVLSHEEARELGA